MRFFVLACCVAVAVAFPLPGQNLSSPGDDPASSWLAYTISQGNGTIVTWVNATWVVPSYPTERNGLSLSYRREKQVVRNYVVRKIASTLCPNQCVLGVPERSWCTVGGNAPGWWFGIEPSPASNLIQPILAYGYGTNGYTIFNGYYQYVALGARKREIYVNTWVCVCVDGNEWKRSSPCGIVSSGCLIILCLLCMQG